MLLEKLTLQNVKFSAPFDLKCANAVFGISSHAGKKLVFGVKETQVKYVVNYEHLEALTIGTLLKIIPGNQR